MTPECVSPGVEYDQLLRLQQLREGDRIHARADGQLGVEPGNTYFTALRRAVARDSRANSVALLNGLLTRVLALAIRASVHHDVITGYSAWCTALDAAAGAVNTLARTYWVADKDVDTASRLEDVVIGFRHVSGLLHDIRAKLQEAEAAAAAQASAADPAEVEEGEGDSDAVTRAASKGSATSTPGIQPLRTTVDESVLPPLSLASPPGWGASQPVVVYRQGQQTQAAPSSTRKPEPSRSDVIKLGVTACSPVSATQNVPAIECQQDSPV